MSASQIINKISDPGTVGIIIGVLGIVVGVFLYFRGKSEKAPRWCSQTAIVLNRNQQIPELQVLFEGGEITQLSTTTLIFWNAGRSSISGEDISRSSPLRICPREDGMRILKADLIAATSDACGFVVSPMDNQADGVSLAFEYLNHRDGCAVRLLHTGAAPRDVIMKGGLRGARPLFYAQRTWWPFWGMMAPIAVIGVVGLVVSSVDSSEQTFAYGTIGIMAISFLFMLWADLRNRPPRKVAVFRYPDPVNAKRTYVRSR